MSRSKRHVEVVPTAEAEAVALPEGWKKRPWVPYLIMGILVAVVLGSGLALQQAVNQPRAVALSNCVTSPAIAVHAFIAPQPLCILPNHKYTATLNTTSGQFVMELLPDYAPVTVNNFFAMALNASYTGSVVSKPDDS